MHPRAGARSKGAGVSAGPNPRRTNSTKRNAVRAQVLAEESDCWICGEPVDKTLDMVQGKHGARCQGDGCWGCSPHPMRAEVDEVVPVSKGGDPYDRHNCRLSHRRCNYRRTARRPAPKPHDPADFPLSDCWARLPWGGTRAPTT